MSNSKERIHDKIENRLQFLITILIFFLVVFPKIEIEGSIIVVFYVINYLLFVTLNHRITENRLKDLNNLILIGIGSYIIPLALVALSASTSANDILPLWQGYAWLLSAFVSIFVMIFAPVALLIMILWFGVKWNQKI